MKLGAETPGQVPTLLLLGITQGAFTCASAQPTPMWLTLLVVGEVRGHIL